jgi:SAM-dependent methyltransferase
MRLARRFRRGPRLVRRRITAGDLQLTMVEAGHLGGYIEGGDPATSYPELWRWLVAERGVRSVLDVGCGEGHSLRFFEELGCRVLGVEGIPQPHERIVAHDYNEGPFVPPPPDADADSRWDLAWSCEFVEHVEERYLPNFLATFAAARLVLMTHAFPGAESHHHANCRPPDYWRGALAAIGFELDEELTARTRELAAANPSPWNHYVRSGLAFRVRA